MGKPINIMSIAFAPTDADAMLSVLNKHIRDGLDLVILPETCTGNHADALPPDSGVISAVCQIAARRQANIIFPLYMAHENAKRVNTALVINREGTVVASYRKMYPYWSEFDIDPPCSVTDAGDCVAQLDIGKIGLAICFDANFPAVWQNLYDLGAEMVVWSSAYSAGMQLAAYSLIHHYPIVTCTQVPDAAVYDIDGREIVYRSGGGGNGDSGCNGGGDSGGDCSGNGGGNGSGNGVGEDGACVMEHTLDLDRRIFHYNFNQDKAEKLIGECGADIEMEKDYWREQWFILRSKSGRASVKELATRYGLTELNAYQEDSRTKIDAMRAPI